MGAITEFRSAASVLMDRLRFFRQAGVTFGGKRDMYSILGYPTQLSYPDYRIRYQRDGIAKRIVEAYPMATWRGGIELYEDEDPDKDTPFETDWKEVERKFNIWQRLQQVDILAGLSTYAVLLIGAPGDLTSPLPKGKPGDLLYFTPFSGGGGPGGDGRNRQLAFDADASISEFDTDTKSERFGDPLSYQLKRTALNGPILARQVHWSRVIHVAEGCLDDNVYGTPTLENVWNLLDDLQKVTGGGSEAFWLRANAGIHLDVDKDMAFAAPRAGEQSELDRLKEQAEEYANQMTRMLRTRGVSVTQLGSDVANFGPSADAILKQIGGSKGIPTRILTGSEMGTLASEQDAANFDSQVQDRRTGYAGPCIVRRLADRLIEYGYLTKPTQYEVGWPVEENMDETGKAGYAVQLASVNQTYGSVVFTDDEIRDMAFDKPPLTDAQKKAVTDAAAAAQPVAPEATPPSTDEKMIAAELRALEEAIEDGDFNAVARLVGLGEHKYATTQITLPADQAESLLAIGYAIPDVDLAPEGLEDDPHVTVKYGLIDPDKSKLTAALAQHQPATFTFGPTAYFEAQNYDVVYVSVIGGNLDLLSKAVANACECAPSDYGNYTPHATVAYVKSGTGRRYAGNKSLDGVQVCVGSVTMITTDGERSEVRLA